MGRVYLRIPCASISIRLRQTSLKVVILTMALFLALFLTKGRIWSVFGTFGTNSGMVANKLYFESEEGYQLRLKLESKIQEDARIKSMEISEQGYNELFLDSLPLIRTETEDFKPPGCSNWTYRKSSKKVSLIMNFHNELLSLLLRSIYTTINSIHPDNFHEYILIDDGSDFDKYPELKLIPSLLDTFMITGRYIRFEENKGLVYARRFGCQQATGDVVLVLDSHVEVKPGFLEPLLHEIEINDRALVTPIFDFWDTVEMTTMSFDGNPLGFDYYLNWYLLTRPKSDRPLEAPSIMGGAFLASRIFLKNVDYFGNGMIGWGAENIELSLKVWYCGGRVLMVPCSRVLHFTAVRRPARMSDRVRPSSDYHNIHLVLRTLFSEEQDNDIKAVSKYDVISTDEYYRNITDTTTRILKEFGCHINFSSLRRRLMPELESFDGDTLLAHTPKVGGACLSTASEKNPLFKIIPVSCEDVQFAMIYRVRLLRDDTLKFGAGYCLDWGYKPLGFVDCHGNRGNQVVQYDAQKKRLHSEGHALCLVYYTENPSLGAEPCHEDSEGQHRNKDNQTFTILDVTFERFYDKLLS